MPHKNQSTHLHKTVLKVRELYSNGLSIQEIVYECNVDKQTVQKWIDNPDLIGMLDDQERIYLWLEDKIKWNSLRRWMIEYLWKEAGNKCSTCGWAEINPASGKCPLETDHIDGNRRNNARSNLRLLCPNCHGMTPTFMHLNKDESINILQNKLKEKGASLVKEGIPHRDAALKVGISEGILKYYLIANKIAYRNEFDEYIKNWIGGNVCSCKHPFIRIYLQEQANFSCTQCGLSEKNPTSGNYILQVDHIDGYSNNNIPSNLRLLCYNCHSLTPTHKTLNYKYLDSQEVRRIADKERKLQERGGIPAKPKILAKYSEQEIFDIWLQEGMSYKAVADKLKVSYISISVKLRKNKFIKEKIIELKEANREKPSLKRKYPSHEMLEILKEPGMNFLNLEKRIGYSRGAITARLKRDGCFEQAVQIIEENKVKHGLKCKYSSEQMIFILNSEKLSVSQLAKQLDWTTSHLNRKLKRSGYLIKDILKPATEDNVERIT